MNPTSFMTWNFVERAAGEEALSVGLFALECTLMRNFKRPRFRRWLLCCIVLVEIGLVNAETRTPATDDPDLVIFSTFYIPHFK